MSTEVIINLSSNEVNKDHRSSALFKHLNFKTPHTDKFSFLQPSETDSVIPGGKAVKNVQKNEHMSETAMKENKRECSFFQTLVPVGAQNM